MLYMDALDSKGKMINKNPETRTDASNGAQDRHFVAVVGKALNLLGVFKGSASELTNQELAEALDMPRSSVARLTHTLTKLGYLESGHSKASYKYGPSITRLALTALRDYSLSRRIRPLMEEAAKATGAAISIGVRDGLDIFFLENVRGPSALVLNIEAGGRIPIHNSSYGYAYLGSCSIQERANLVADIKKSGLLNDDELEALIDKSAEQLERLGYCLNIGQWHPDVSAIAIPVHRPNGNSPFIVGCGGSSSSLNEERLALEVYPQLRTIANALRESA